MQIVKKVLIVDDRSENIVALEILLKKLDIEIVRATSGNEALTKTLEHDFALALIDVQMPDMDGFETVKLMRQIDKTKFLPVIFLSAIYSEDHYKIQGIEAGAVDFITKPFLSKVILGKVKIFLDLYENKKKLELEIEQRKQTEVMLRETEKKLIEAKNRAEESDRLKSAFLANMSHEIRTPLTSIVGFSGLLSEMELDDDSRKNFAKVILKSSEGLINIINDILDISKIEAGQLKIAKQVININEILTDLYATFEEILKRKDKSNVVLKLVLPDEPVFSFVTDETRLKQVISNLLANAVKFTLKGTIEFGYYIKDSSLMLYVIDSGIGIPKEKFDVIFDRFQKLDNTNVHNSSGTGLGLSIVKKIVELLGGEIKVESELKKGSSFYIKLPYIQVDDLQYSSQIKDKETGLDHYSWNNKKLLIVEDDSPTFLLLENMLKFTHVEIHWAKNGQEAINLYKKHQYKLVLMDINLPVMTGVEAFIELRKLSEDLPIIAQTAYALAEDKEQLKKIGFNGYITKPFEKKDLLQIINTFMTDNVSF